ncbi:hypothetical protein N824_04770 [Pedobacter sp. V48]|nr:hypothetical protein N824_04770 [Pedobacter sp. V48]
MPLIYKIIYKVNSKDHSIQPEYLQNLDFSFKFLIIITKINYLEITVL